MTNTFSLPIVRQATCASCLAIALLCTGGVQMASAERLVAMTIGKAFIGVPETCKTLKKQSGTTRRCKAPEASSVIFVTLDEYRAISIETFGEGKPDPNLGVNYAMGFGFNDFATESVGGNTKFILKQQEVAASKLPKGVSACVKYIFDQTSADKSQRAREIGLYCATSLNDAKGSAITTIASVAWVTTQAETTAPPKGFDTRAAAILSTFKRN